MAETTAQERLNQDLGLGGRMSERSTSRLVNHDGTFNVRRTSDGRFHRYNAYHTLLSMSVPRLLVMVAALYVLANLLFASLYWMLGITALSGAAADPLSRFQDCFFFSVQTLATIGYGRLVPNSVLANALVAVEALVGLLGFAILSALLFARFTRPSARITFSDQALIAPYGNSWALMFRLANLRKHDLTEVHATVTVSRWVVETNGVRRRRFDSLALERSFILFMPLHWVVVHPITDTSPLTGLTQADFVASEPEVVCLVSGHDETFAQLVHAKTSYDKHEIVWGARFRDMYLADVDKVAIDLARLHEYDGVAPPSTV